MSNALNGWKGSFTVTCYTRIMPDTRLWQYLVKDLCDPLLQPYQKRPKGTEKIYTCQHLSSICLSQLGSVIGYATPAHLISLGQVLQRSPI